MVSSIERLGVNEHDLIRINDLTPEIGGIDRERSGKIGTVIVPRSYPDLEETARSLLTQHKAKKQADD